MGEFDSIKIIIPTCEASSKLSIGFLPGDLDSKIIVYKEASIYSLTKILEESGCNDAESVVRGLISEKKITFEIVSYIRGKTFDNMLILVEEAVNSSSLATRNRLTESTMETNLSYRESARN